MKIKGTKEGHASQLKIYKESEVLQWKVKLTKKIDIESVSKLNAQSKC